MNVRKGVKNIVYSILGQAITMILGIVIPRLVIVSYGSEVNGLLNSVSQVIGYLALLEAGVGAAALQALYRPVSDDNRDGVNAIVSATHYYYRRTGVIYFAVTVVMSFVYPLIIKADLDYWFMAVIILICGIPNVINYFFQGKLKIFLNAVGDNYVLTNLQTVTSVAASLAKIGLLLLGVNVIAVQAIYCVVSLLQMIFIYAYVKHKYSWITVKVEPNNEALSQKNSTLIHQICGIVTNSTDVVVLSIFCDLKIASIYTIYNMIFNIVYNVVQSANNGVTFIIGQSFCKGKEYYKKIIDTYEAYYLSITSAVMCTACILINPFLSLYTAGADIKYTDNILPLLFAGFYFLSAMRLSSLNTISAAGHFEQTRKHAIIESAINLVVSLVLVNVMEHFWGVGLYGVLIGTIVALIYRNIVAIHYSNTKILERNSYNSIKIIVSNVFMVTAVLLVGQLIPINAPDYLTWVLYAIPVFAVIMILFLTLNSVLNPKSFTLIKDYLFNKIKSRRKKKE